MIQHLIPRLTAICDSRIVWNLRSRNILLADDARIKIDLAAGRDTLSDVKFAVVLAFRGPLS